MKLIWLGKYTILMPSFVISIQQYNLFLEIKTRLK